MPCADRKTARCDDRLNPPNTCPSSKPSASPRTDRAVGRQRRRQLRQRFGRDDQWSLQGRGHPQAWTPAILRSGGIRDPRMGRLAQPSPTAGAHRQHPACRSRRLILCCRGQHRYGSRTHNPTPPVDPARFIVFGDRCSPSVFASLLGVSIGHLIAAMSQARTPALRSI